MDTIQSIQWLRKHDLYETTHHTSLSLQKIFQPCFGVTDEKILIIGDKGTKDHRVAPVMSGAYYLAAKTMGYDAKLVLQDPKPRGDQAERETIDALGSLEEKNVVFLNMSDKLGSIKELGKSFRKFCHKKKHRFISAISLGDLPQDKLPDVVSAIDVDYKPMQAMNLKVKQQLDEAKDIHITTPGGTDLHYNVEGMKAICAAGDYKEPGSGGNMPAGETYIPCNTNKVEGKVVIDVSSRNHRHTTLIKEPITLTVEDGGVVNVEGGEEAKKLENTYKWAAGRAKHPKTVYRVGELGIGLNPKAKVIGSTVVDEKVMNTCHIATGSNYWFGGSIYAIIHLDQVMANPTILLDGKKLEL